MASKVTPWYKKKRVSQVQSDYAYQHTQSVRTKQQTAVRKSSSTSVSQVKAQATQAMAEQSYTVPVFRQRTAEEGTEEYQRVSTNVEKGLIVIQEELHRMRMVTKARVDSLAIQREVNEMMYRRKDSLEEIPRMPDFLVALRPHTVWEKTPVRLFCTVEGTPRPVVKWYKGGVPVDPLSAPGKYKIENKYGVHGLVISRYAPQNPKHSAGLRSFQGYNNSVEEDFNFLHIKRATTGTIKVMFIEHISYTQATLNRV
ncbi:hypothetical protein VZT92_022818 [Zoarces viviparus]|uniref:Ig-like domain-containing protein n=1 Tax=Zoarces viviparus TaxID=48416 RepID=A0AAW1E820_ZOAVI